MLLPLFFQVAAATTATATTTSTPLPPPPPPAAVQTRGAAPARSVLPPPRGELEVGIGVAGGATVWPGDPLGYGSLVIGLRLFRFVTPFVGGAFGYARVDQRLLTRLTFGVQFGWPILDRFNPRAFAAFVHQHEESLAAFAQEPGGALLGIGTAIRHRAGVYFGAGFDVIVLRRPRLNLAVGPELSAMYLTYSSGPDWYVFGGVALTGRFRLF